MADGHRFEDRIAEALVEAFDEKDKPGYETSGIGQAFFRMWFKEKRGEALFFVFRKSLKVTNLQLGELLALVSRFTVSRDERKQSPGLLQFVRTEGFADTVNGLVVTHPDVKQSMEEGVPLTLEQRKEVANWFAERYAHLLRNTVVVDPFVGCCAVYVPYHLALDLRIVCGLSGYIHSCGRNIFVRNVSKAKRKHFQQALENYFDRKEYVNSEKPTFFSAYAHEDFDQLDRDRDLDDLKLHVEKFFMDGEPLVDVLFQIEEKFQSRLHLAGPGPINEQRRKLADDEHGQPSIDPDRTVWLLADYGTTAEGKRRNERYFICYEQMFHNANPFQIFDENKPGWVEHTTIPHSLLAAMINITLPHWPSEKVRIADPFGGAGTTWLEAVGKFGDAEVLCSDLWSLAADAAYDNGRFFALSDKQLDAVANDIVQIKEAVARRNPSSSRHLRRLSEKVQAWQAHKGDVTDESLSQDLTERVLFYLALRTNKRHALSFQRYSMEWPLAFASEAETLVAQITEFKTLKQELSHAVELDTLATYRGTYSTNVTIASDRFRAILKSKRPVGNCDARDLWPEKHGKKRFDVIVTDPPYGFNTDESVKDLATLYVEFLRAAISSIADRGQLVLCLPESSVIGKTPLPFTHRSVIIHQVVALAREAGRRVMPTIDTVPGRALFGPPYYWESERALRRSILHFRFQIVDPPKAKEAAASVAAAADERKRTGIVTLRSPATNARTAAARADRSRTAS